MRYVAAAVVTAGTLGLSGCTGSTNPAEASFFDNIVNLNRGEYDRQIQEKDAQVASISASNAATEARIQGQRSTRATNAALISDLKSAITAARADISRAKQALAAEPAKLQEVNAIEVRINAVARDVDRGEASGGALEQVNRLRQEIRALTI